MQILPFQKPVGFWGHVTGWIMARQNAVLNRITIRELCVTDSDEILEIGFGPGAAFEMLLKNTAARKVYGIDISDVMIEQAMTRNQKAIDSGRLLLLQGSVCELPFENQQFTKVFAVSTLHDWPDRTKGLREIKRVLKPNGMLVLCVRRVPKFSLPWSSPGLTREEIAKDLELLSHLGFKNAHCLDRSRRHRITCLIART